MLKDFLFKRPDWFRHEGSWRLAQVFRLGPTFIFVIISLIAVVSTTVMFFLSATETASTVSTGSLYPPANQAERYGLAFLISMAWFAGGVAYFTVAHWLLRLIVWITDGFKGGEK